MATSQTVSNYLQEQGIVFDIVKHKRTNNSRDTSFAAHIALKNIAKGLLLKDHQDQHLLAVLPACNKLDLRKLNSTLDRDLHLVSEVELENHFLDCETGAIPPIGQAFNVDSIWDEELMVVDDVYLEAGDHEDLIHMSQKEFSRLMKGVPHNHFSVATDSPYNRDDYDCRSY